MEAFRKRVISEVVKRVDAATCVRCNTVGQNALREHTNTITCSCTSSQSPSHVPQRSEQFKLNLWMRVVLVEVSYDFDAIMNFLYRIPMVVQNVEIFVEIAPIFAYIPSISYTASVVLQKSIELYKEYPGLQGCDFIHAFRNMRRKYPIYISAHSLDVWSREYADCILAIYASKVSAVWEEWFMETPVYTAYIQWLPREMMEDVVWFEGKRALP